MYVVNAPMLFTGVWAMVKGFLDEKTRKKITIKGSKYEKDLLELVETENLPDFLGGTCTCEGLGGCIRSAVGPWNDYEIVKPIGIRRKDMDPQNENGGIKKEQEEEKKQQ